LKVIWTSQFKKDYKRAIKQGRPLKELKDLAEKLERGEQLAARYKDHILNGKPAKKGDRECHIKPDWLLIYRIRKETLIFIRLGSHAELFK